MSPHRANPNDTSNQYIESMSDALTSLDIESRSDQPNFHQDGGLSCFMTQLKRVNNKLIYNDSSNQVFADYEEEDKREIAASLAKSMIASSDVKDVSKKSKWIKCYDDEIGAEYYYNSETGEASWVDPET